MLQYSLYKQLPFVTDFEEGLKNLKLEHDENLWDSIVLLQ